MEQRGRRRKAVILPATIDSERWFGRLRGGIRDLSLSGLYMRVETGILPIGARVNIVVHLPTDDGDGEFRLEGRVRHQSLHGVGIEFDPLDTGSYLALARILRPLPEQPPGAFPVLRIAGVAE